MAVRDRAASRVYGPNGHTIEVRQTMERVVTRLQKEGMRAEQAAKKPCQTPEFLAWLNG